MNQDMRQFHQTQADWWRPGERWLDTDGRAIQAHGGGILYDRREGRYYWYGEHKGVDNEGEFCPAVGVGCYSSADLHSWRYEGLALPVFNNPEFAAGGELGDDTPLYRCERSEPYRRAAARCGAAAPVPTLDRYNRHGIDQLNRLYDGLTFREKKTLYEALNCRQVVERPKILYNDATGRYVMWMHLDHRDYRWARGGVAVSDSPAGPFRFLGSVRLNEGAGTASDERGDLRDMTLFQDDDGTAYLIYATEHNATLMASRLDETYTRLSGGEEGVHFQRILPDQNREAPAMFKRNGSYYLITSGLTGWLPNRARYYRADKVFGPWTCLGDPCVGDTAGTTFDSQSTFVLQLRDGNGAALDRYVFLADRWKSDCLRDSRYVWLPIAFREDGTLEIAWRDAWR